MIWYELPQNKEKPASAFQESFAKMQKIIVWKFLQNIFEKENFSIL